MKYLASFVVFLILVSMINSSQINSKDLKNFLVNLQPGSKAEETNLKINSLLKKPSSSNFRFSQKSKLKESETSNLQTQYMTSLPVAHEGWTKVNSDFFKLNNDIPSLLLPDGNKHKLNLDDKNNLINDAYQDNSENNSKGLNKLFFYFRINKTYTYFSSNDKDFNIVFYFRNDMIKEVINKNDDKFCIQVSTFPLGTKDSPKFSFCNKDREEAITLDCILRKVAKGDETFAECKDKKKLDLSVKEIKYVTRKVKQPFIIIPTPQRMCNQNWTYENKGSNWECLCASGKEQSPIDLPPTDKAIQSPIRPYMNYDYFNDGENKLKIQHDKGALKIIASDDLLKIRGFGKVVTQDGTVYYATDVIFHTPSEHTIDGKQYPLEIQILHEAKSKGDFGKKVVLSFLFTSKPGIYNKFIDDIEFFNLPNPHDKNRTLHNKLFIPNILLNAEEESYSVIRPFSFYTYQGSQTSPPCVENVIHYVASQPIPASTTAIDLIKESLRYPDFEDSMGNIITAKETPLQNNRLTQPLNGRPVFFYDHEVFNPPEFTANNKEDEKYEEKKNGHYEKQNQEVTNYFYVEGSDLSGIPGAILVSEDEAKK